MLCILAACKAPDAKSSQSHAGTHAWTAPVPGTIVAADSIRIKEDKLNDAWFSVRLSVDTGQTGAAGGAVYAVHAAFGHASGDGQITMPKGGAHLRPLLRKDSAYSYTIGFIPGAEYGGDTTFHGYYRVSGNPEQISITPLKGFSIQ